MTMMILFGLSVLPATNFFITPRPQQEAHKSMQRIKLIYYGLIQRNKIVCLAQKDKWSSICYSVGTLNKWIQQKIYFISVVIGGNLRVLHRSIHRIKLLHAGSPVKGTFFLWIFANSRMPGWLDSSVSLSFLQIVPVFSVSWRSNKAASFEENSINYKFHVWTARHFQFDFKEYFCAVSPT